MRILGVTRSAKQMRNERVAQDELQMNSRHTLLCECLAIMCVRNYQRVQCLVDFINQKNESPITKPRNANNPLVPNLGFNRRKTLRTLQNTKTRRQKIHRTLNARHRNTKTHQTNRCKNHTMTNATCPKLKAHAGDDLDCSGSPRAHCRLEYKILQTTDRR